MLADKITIRFIYFASLILAILALSALVFVFAREYTQLQDRSINKEFATITTTQAAYVDEQIAHARRNLLRLKEYIAILNLTDGARSLQSLRLLMARNISFEPNEYNCYFAFEKELAQKYYGKDGFIYTVHKNYADLGKPDYGKPENSVAQVWTDPDYQTNENEIWYHAAKRSQELEITRPYFDQSFMKKWMFTAALGIYDAQNRFTGMVGIDILLDGLFEEIEKLQVGNTGDVVLVNHQTGMVLTRTEETIKEGFITSLENFSTNLYMESRDKSAWQPILTRNRDVTSVTGQNGAAYMVSTKMLKELPWTVVVFQSQAELKEALRQSIRRFVRLGSLLLLAVSLFAYLLAKSITTPIRGLVSSMSRIKGSDVAGITAPVTGIAETRRMGVIFNRMIGSISEAVAEKERYYAQLEEINQTLEQKVEERTAELREKSYRLEAAMQKLKETQEQLIVKEKLASLGSLTAGIAHEIENPLNFVNNFSALSVDLVTELEEIIEEKFGPQDELYKESKSIFADLEMNLRKINEHGRRADGIVKNMLQLSRGQSSEKRAINIHSILDEYVTLACHGMKATDADFAAEIVKNYAENLPPVELIVQDASRAFLNIFNNALYALHEKARTAGPDYRPAIEITTVDGGSHLQVAIRDNGTGMSDDVVGKIFTPFFTKKPAGLGTGLGLAITHDIIVGVHRGEILVNTREGEYSEFIIKIPYRLEES